MNMTVNTLQASAERHLTRAAMTPEDGRAAALDTVAALRQARETHSHLLASQSETRQLQLAVQQVQAEARVEAAEHQRTAGELAVTRALLDNRRVDYSRDFTKAKAGKAAVVAKLREARAALQAIRDVNEDHNLGTGATAVRIGRLYDSILGE